MKTKTTKTKTKKRAKTPAKEGAKNTYTTLHEAMVSFHDASSGELLSCQRVYFFSIDSDVLVLGTVRMGGSYRYRRLP